MTTLHAPSYEPENRSSRAPIDLVAVIDTRFASFASFAFDIFKWKYGWEEVRFGKRNTLFHATTT